MRPSFGRVFLGTIAVALVACCGWWLLRVDTEYGSALGPDRILAEETGSGDFVRMAARARNALGDRPIDGQAYRLLGMSFARQGENERSIALYEVAVRRDPRDWQARAFLMDAAFRRGAAGEGARHLDAILRVAPHLAHPLLQVLAKELGDAHLRRAVVDLVAAQPPWASRMMAALHHRSADPADAAIFLEELSTRRALTPSERSTLIDVLLQAGRAGDARTEWLATLDADARALAGNLFDGDFEEATPVTGEFAWSWDAGTGVDLSLEQGHAASGSQSLRIDFSGRAVSLRAPSQRLVVPAGHYTLSGAFDDRTNASRPFTLVITCTPGAELGRVDLSGGTPNDWARFEISFDVPEGCTQQRLWLAFRSRSIADSQVAGVLHIDNLDLRKNLP